MSVNEKDEAERAAGAGLLAAMDAYKAERAAEMAPVARLVADGLAKKHATETKKENTA